MSRPSRGGLSHLSSRSSKEGNYYRCCTDRTRRFRFSHCILGAVPAETTRGQAHSVLLWGGVGTQGGAFPGFESLLGHYWFSKSALVLADLGRTGELPLARWSREGTEDIVLYS